MRVARQKSNSTFDSVRYVRTVSGWSGSMLMWTMIASKATSSKHQTRWPLMLQAPRSNQLSHQNQGVSVCLSTLFWVFVGMYNACIRATMGIDALISQRSLSLSEKGANTLNKSKGDEWQSEWNWTSHVTGVHTVISVIESNHDKSVLDWFNAPPSNPPISHIRSMG